MNPPRRLRGTFGMCNLREGFVNLREGFVVAPWRLREAFSKTRSAKASRSPLEGFAKASRRRHGRLHLETIRQIMTSPRGIISAHKSDLSNPWSQTQASLSIPSYIKKNTNKRREGEEKNNRRESLPRSDRKQKQRPATRIRETNK